MSKANNAKLTVEQLEQAMFNSVEQSENNLEKYVRATEDTFFDLCDRSINCMASRRQTKRANQTLAFFSKLPQAYGDYYKARFEKVMLVIGDTVEIGGAGEYNIATSSCRIGYTLPDGSTVFDKKLLKKKDLEVAVYGFILLDGAKFANNWKELNKYDACDIQEVLATPHKKAEEKATKLYNVDDIKKRFKALYKKSDVNAKKFLADICREKGIDIA